MEQQVRDMLAEAVDCEVQFAEDLLEQGVSGMSPADMREYLQHVADRRLTVLGIEPVYGSKNPFAFMELQDVQELSNFFERRVSAYQVGGTGGVTFDDDFGRGRLSARRAVGGQQTGHGLGRGERAGEDLVFGPVGGGPHGRVG